MPQATDQHRQHEAGSLAEPAVAISAERNVQVVAQPGAQADVPSAPEVAEPDRGVRVAKVVGERETETKGGADGAGRVAGKVEEDLPGECERPQPGGGERDAVRFGVDHVGDRREQLIRQNRLLEQSHRQQDEAPAHLTGVGAFRLETLRQELGSADDRTGNQLWKEGHEECVVEKRRRGAQSPPVNVDRVRQRLEGVEANPYWQHDPRRGGLEHDADPGSEFRKALQQKGRVLEVGQDTEIRTQAEHEPRAARGAPAGIDALAGNPVDHGRHDEQTDEGRIPGGVEQVA